MACALIGEQRICRADALNLVVNPNGSPARLTITLGGTGTVAGRYYESDGLTAVPFAQIAVSGGTRPYGYATTNAQGDYSLEGIPLGAVTVTGRNAVTGRAARRSGNLAYDGQTITLNLREDALGEVAGHVLDWDGVLLVPGATVEARPSSPLFLPIVVTAGPGARFEIPGVPPGMFTLLGSYQASTGRLTGEVQAEMPDPPTTIERDVVIEPRARIQLQVIDASGQGVSRAEVRLDGQPTAHASELGALTLTAVPLGVHTVSARDSASNRSRSVAVGEVNLRRRGDAPSLTLALSGVGSIQGTVRTEAGEAVAGAQVDLEMAAPFDGPYARVHEQPTTDDSGSFSISNVTPGPVQLSAVLRGVGGEAQATVVAETVANVTMTLSPSADVSGRVVFDGGSPAGGTDVSITYQAAAGLDGFRTTRANTLGAFTFAGVPLGDVAVRAVATFDGRRMQAYRALTASTGIINLGDLVLDDESPSVAYSDPEDGARGVATTSTITVTFSERMDDRIRDPLGIYLTDGITRIPAALAWECSTPADCSTVHIVLLNHAELASTTRYSLVIVAGDQPGFGTPTAQGPRDLAGWPLAASRVITFTTRDAVPPHLFEMTPEDGERQVAVETIIRASYNEPLDPASRLELTDASGTPVPGTSSLGLNNQVLAFIPSAVLSPNTYYDASIVVARDTAQNSAEHLPITHRFWTIDTLGPVIADLHTVGGLPFVQGTTVELEATLADPTDASTAQLDLSTSAGFHTRSAAGRLRAPLPLPDLGRLSIRAFAIDRYGMQGPQVLLSVEVVPNGPPEVTIANVTSGGTPVSGGEASFLVSAIDDSAVASIEWSLSVGGVLQSGVTQQGPGPISIAQLLSSDLPAQQTVRLTVSAVDNAGLASSTAALELDIADGVSPVVTATGPQTAVSAGDLITIHVESADAFGVREISVLSSSGFTATDLLPSPAGALARDFSFTVPAEATDGRDYLVEVTARDDAQHISRAYVEVHVRDTSPPFVVATYPANQATNVPPMSEISVTFSELVANANETTISLTDVLGSPIAGTVHLNGSTAYFMPLGGLVPGTSYRIGVASSITDYSGNPLEFSFESTFSTGTPDFVGPALVAWSPADAASSVDPDTTMTFTFDEPPAENTVTGRSITVSRNGQELAGTVTQSGNDLVFTPATRLPLGAQLVARLDGALADGAGNGITNQGATFDHLDTTFTTAVLAVVPAIAGQTHALEGSSFAVRVEHDAFFTPTDVTWNLDGLSSGTTAGTLTFRTPNLTSPTERALVVGANVATQRGVVTATPLTILIEPGAADFDGDGFANALEAARGTDPWRNDASEDLDGDGLSNGQELALGTDPTRADSDGDGMLDSEDPAPLDGARRPGCGQLHAGNALRFSGAATESLEIPMGLAAPFTLEAWLRPSAEGPVLDSGTLGPLAVTYEGGRFAVIAESAALGPITMVAPLASAADAWHHLAVSHDGTTLAIYVDGLLVARASNIGALVASSAISIGHGYTGVVDQVRLWAAARSADEIQLSMHRASLQTSTDLTGDWHLDESSGLSAGSSVDSAPAVVGGATWEGSYAPLYSDFDLAAPATGAVVGVTCFDFDEPQPSFPAVRRILTTLPRHGRVYLHSLAGRGSEILTVPTVLPNGSLEYVPAQNFIGTDRIDLVGNDGTQAQPGLNSAPVRVALHAGELVRWIGGFSNSWGDAANWLVVSNGVHRVPGGPLYQSDAVEISANLGNAVLVPASAIGAIGALSVGTGTTLTIESSSPELWVSSTLTADGLIVGSTVRLTGVGSTVSGHIAQLKVTGQATLAGDLEITSNLTVDPSSTIPDQAKLTVGAHHLIVAGTFSGRTMVDMADPAGEVVFDGDVTLGGRCGTRSTTTRLSAGTIRIRGSLSQACFDSGVSLFPGSGTHRLIVDGSGAQTLILNQGTMRHVEVANSQAIVNLWGFGAISGDLTLGPDTRTDVNKSVSGHVTVGTNATLTGSIDLRFAQAPTVLADGAHVSISDIYSANMGSWSIGAGVTAHATDTFHLTSGTVPSWLTFDGLELWTSYALPSPLTLSGNVVVQANGELDLAGHNLEVGGTFTVNDGGTLRMEQGEDLRIARDATFSADSCVGSMSPTLLSGTIHLGAGLSALSSGSCPAIYAGGTHRFILEGPGSSLSVWGPSQFASIRVQGSYSIYYSPPTVLGDLEVLSGGLDYSGFEPMAIGGTLTVLGGTFNNRYDNLITAATCGVISSWSGAPPQSGGVPCVVNGP